MHRHRLIDGFDHDFLRFAVITPRIATHIIVCDFGGTMDFRIGFHTPCFTENCEDHSHFTGCDLFGEASCHLFDRLDDDINTLDDEAIFAMLDEMVDRFLERE